MFNTLEKFIEESGIQIETKAQKLKILKNEFAKHLSQYTEADLLDDGTALRVTIPTCLVAAARPRAGRHGVYLPDPYRTFKTVLVSHLRTILEQLGGGMSNIQASEYVGVDIVYHYALPNSYSKKKKSELMNFFKNTKPDLDNLDKCLLDSITQSGLILDDKVICRKSSDKYWGEDDSTTFTLTLLRK